MALENLFEMAKADRYTQDGREELIKAQKAETEDARPTNGIYHWKSGDYRKEGNKYVKIGPGTGGAGRNHGTEQKKRGPGAIHTPGKGSVGIDKMKEAAEKGLKGQELKEFMTGAKSENKTTVRQGPNTKTLNETPAEHIKKNWDYYAEPGRYGQEDMEQLVLSPSGYKETDSYSVMGGGKRVQYSKEGAENIVLFYDKNGELDDYEIEAAPKAQESKPAETSKAPKPSAQEYMKAKQRVKAYEAQYKKDMDDYEYMERIKANGIDPSIFNPMYGGKPKPLEENKSYMEELNKIKAYEAEDAAYTAQSINAPREKLERTLTGDTRIRVRK